MKENTFKKIVEGIEPAGAGGKETPPKKRVKKAGPAAPPQPDYSKIEIPTDEELAEAQADIYARTSGKDYSAEMKVTETAEEKARRERKDKEEFERLKAEFDENEKKIFEGRERVGKKWRIISGTLEAVGLRKKQFKDDEVKEYIEKREDLRRKLMEAGNKALGTEVPEFQDFLVRYDKRMIAIRSRVEEDKLRVENSKNWASKALVGFANISKNYRDFISRQFLSEEGKLSVKGIAKGVATAAAIGMAMTSVLAASLPALGVVAVGSAGATGAAIWRGFGSVGAGYAAKKRMEAGFIEATKKEIQRDVLRKIEAAKTKTGEEWRHFIDGMEGGKSIGETEQEFASKDRKHKLLGLGLAAGTFIAGTIASHFAADIKASAKGLLAQAWDKVFGSGPKTGGAIIPSEIGSKGVVPEKIPKPFLGDTHMIKSGENMWKVTRDLYLEHADKYGYSDEQAQKLFASYKKSGILNRLGMRGVDNFANLTTDQKHKIWAEWKTGKEIQFYKSWHGGRIKDLVHAGDMVTMDQNGHIFFGDTSGIKAGYLHQDIPQGAGRAAAYETGGKKMIDTSEFDRQIEAARARGLAADEQLRHIRGPVAAQLAEEAELIKAAGVARVSDYLNLVEGKISGIKIDPNGKAIDLYNQLEQRALITSDQHMAPPSDIFGKDKYWNFLKEIYGKLGRPQYPNERTADWIYRGILEKKISPESIHLSLPRAVNQ